MAMHKNSLLSKMLELEIGERMYVERTLGNYQALQRQATAKSRYPTEMKSRAYSTSIFTAVSSEQVGNIRYLVCIERTA